MRRGLMAAALAGSMLASGCGIGEAGPDQARPVDTATVIPDRQEVLIKDAYARMQQHWKGRLTAKLVLVEGNDEVTCRASDYSPVDTYTANSEPVYCPDKDIVVMTGRFVTTTALEMAKDDQAVADAGLVYALGHEVGHGVRRNDYGLSEGSRPPEITQIFELDADRLAGQAMCGAGYDQEARDQATIFMAGFGDGDPEHGPAQKRIDFFALGLKDAGCKV